MRPSAPAQLLPIVYAELRQPAAARLAAEKPGHTLQPTALVLDAAGSVYAAGTTWTTYTNTSRGICWQQASAVTKLTAAGGPV